MTYIQDMKTEIAKQTEQKSLNVTTDPRLDALFEGKVLFPAKLAQAKEFTSRHPLTEHLRQQKT